jgi:hypothetical protein
MAFWILFLYLASCSLGKLNILTSERRIVMFPVSPVFLLLWAFFLILPLWFFVRKIIYSKGNNFSSYLFAVLLDVVAIVSSIVKIAGKGHYSSITLSVSDFLLTIVLGSIITLWCLLLIIKNYLKRKGFFQKKRS